MSNTSSEDIIRHIIRDIVARSTFLQKSKKDAALRQRNPEPRITSDHVDPQGGKSGEENTVDHPIKSTSPGPTKHATIVTPPASSVSYHITDTLAAFMVRAVVVDPKYEFKIENELSREEVERLVKICVERITASNIPYMECVKMQVYFDTTFPMQHEHLHKEKVARLNNANALLRDITESKNKTIPALEALYRKIVSFLLIRANVGSPTNINVIREATAALESVFPQSELNSFFSLSRADKESQLNGLTQLVTGIRLFNRHLGKGGEGIDNVPELCDAELGTVTVLVHDLTEQAEEGIQTFQAILDLAYSPAGHALLSDSLLETARQVLVIRRQMVLYLDALQEQLFVNRGTLKSLTEKYEATLNELKQTCRSKSAVPVDHVYPHFMALAQLWTSWQDELFLLSFRRGIADTVQYFATNFSCPVSEAILESAKPFVKEIEPENLDEEAIIANATELMTAISAINKKFEIVHPGNTTLYYRLPVELGGFCPFILTSRNGLAQPGNWNYGLLRYRDRVYALSGPEAAFAFARDPDGTLERVLELARAHPELVQLTHLYAYFPTVEALETAKSFAKQKLLGQMPLVAEAGTMTDTHIVDTFKDPNHRWNEWEMRRRALMMVNLRKKETHSQQTTLSHFRRENQTQLYLPKEQSTQTTKESETSMPRQTRYLAGLRNDGKKTGTFCVVDLKLEL